MKLSASPLFAVLLVVRSGQAVDIQECYLPLDVMFVQDTTGSFTEDLPNVVSQIPEMLGDIESQHPNSRFGVAEFHDKPFAPLGEPADFCYLLDQSLSSNITSFRSTYSRLGAWGGIDGPEASYHALINVLEDENVHWRPLSPEKGKVVDPAYAGARVVILSTDAVPHLPGDCLKYDSATYPQVPKSLPSYSGSPYPLVDGNIDWQCSAQDYPSPDQVLSIYQKHDAHLVILTPEDPSISAAWKWVNEDLFKQPAGFYQYIKSDSSDILQGVLNALEVVTATACAATTETPQQTDSQPRIEDFTRHPEAAVSEILRPTVSARTAGSSQNTIPTIAQLTLTRRSTAGTLSRTATNNLSTQSPVLTVTSRLTSPGIPTVAPLTRTTRIASTSLTEQLSASLTSSEASQTSVATTLLERTSSGDLVSTSFSVEATIAAIPTVAPITTTSSASITTLEAVQSPPASLDMSTPTTPAVTTRSSASTSDEASIETLGATTIIPTESLYTSDATSALGEVSTTESSAETTLATEDTTESSAETTQATEGTTESSAETTQATEGTTESSAETTLATTESSAETTQATEGTAKSSNAATTDMSSAQEEPSSATASASESTVIDSSLVSQSSAENSASTTSLGSSDEQLTALSSDLTEDVEADSEQTILQDDCCPHVHIKMMKAPKQWKILVVN